MTQLPNPFLNPSVISPRTERSAVASKPPPAADAAAAPNSALASAMTADTDVAPDLTDPPVAASVLFAEPSMTMEVPSEASAPAPTKNPDADALEATCKESLQVQNDMTDCISEIFFYARKLMKRPSSFVLDEAAFMADIDETPLFIREDGYLKRQA